MVRTLTALLTAGALAAAGTATAKDVAPANLAYTEGAVQVSHNGKLTPAKTGALAAGDRVVARNGQANLIYADGCVITLKPGSMATIGAASPCVSGAGLVKVANGASAQSSVGELSPFGLVAGALAVGGLIYGIGSLIHNANEDDPVPVSP